VDFIKVVCGPIFFWTGSSFCAKWHKEKEFLDFKTSMITDKDPMRELLLY
jgi:hypothetical protein